MHNLQTPQANLPTELRRSFGVAPYYSPYHVTRSSSPRYSSVIGTEYVRTDTSGCVTLPEVLEEVPVTHVRSWKGS